MSTDAVKERMRVTLDLPKDRVDAIDRLAVEAGMETRKEVFNNALSLLNWAIGEVRRGRSIMSVDDVEGTMRHLTMPFLAVLEAKAQARPKLKNSGQDTAA